MPTAALAKPRTTEKVLVVPASVLASNDFRGLSRNVQTLLPLVLQSRELRFMDRDEAETNEKYKQLIPYVIFRCATRVFHYCRGKGSGEARLHAKRSIGVGGHINPCDGSPTSAESYSRGMWREVDEEVAYTGMTGNQVYGLVNYNGDPVGRVHLGIVHIVDLAAPSVSRREDCLTDDGFDELVELSARREEFELWSAFVIEALMKGD